MNNIDLYIQELETSKVEIKEAIIAKGVTPTGGLSSYAAAINDIEGATIETDDLGVLINENGSYYYTPEGDGFTSVSVTVDVIPPPVITQEKDVTITSNGETIVTPDSGFDGLNEVNISVEVPIPTFETETLSVELKSNGNYNYTPTEDGYSSVEVVVDVAGSGGDGKPKIYNGFRFTGGDMSAVEFTQYDWSRVYDTSSFFEGTKHSTGDWSNFESGFNGKFYNCRKLFSSCLTPSVPMIDTSNATDMSYMFSGSYLLDAVPMIDTSNATDMSYMFNGCTGLVTIPQFDTSKVTNMSYMFNNCNAMTSVPMIDTSNATDMSYMFSSCPRLVTIPQFDTSKVTNMSYMFNGCYGLTTVPMLDTSKVTVMNRMFYSCTGLQSFELSDTSQVTNMSEICYACKKLQSFSLSDLSNVTSMSGAFRDCKVLQTASIPATPKVSNFEGLFADCSELTSAVIEDASGCTSATNMFMNCIKLKEVQLYNSVKLKNFGGYAYNTWLGYCTTIQKIGAINCDTVNNISYFFGNASRQTLTEFGGCINLGKSSSLSGTNGNYFMMYAPNLNYQSLLNVLNGLYDRKTAGYSVLTLKLHANHHTLLSDDDIAIATNKGWTIS